MFQEWYGHRGSSKPASVNITDLTCKQGTPVHDLEWDLRWGSEVSLSMDQPNGTVCHLHYVHQCCHRMPSHMHWIPAINHPTMWDVSMRFQHRIQMTDLLTYLKQRWKAYLFCSVIRNTKYLNFLASHCPVSSVMITICGNLKGVQIFPSQQNKQ